jgi:putative membrane protein
MLRASRPVERRLAAEPRERIRAIKIALYAAAFLGLALATYLVADAGAARILEAMGVIGWGLVVVTLFHLVPMILSNLSWRELLPKAGRPRTGALLWIRWIRESINSLLPVGQVGGDVICIRLVHQRGVPAAPAIASMVADLTIGVFTQMIFVMMGLALLLAQSIEPAVLAVVWAVLIGLAILLGLMLAFLLVQRAGMFALMARIAGAVMTPAQVLRLGAVAAAIDANTRALYRDKRAFWTAMGWRLVDWIAGTGEVWLLMYFLGKPISLAEAFILESLAAGVRAAAFLVPGALGVLEGSFIVFGGLFGISAADSLVLVLGKRVRELALGIPGLVAWQLAEGHRLFSRGRGAQARDPGPLTPDAD